MTGTTNKFVKKHGSSYKEKPPKPYGFTLIELMVVMLTMVLLFTLGYANYRQFQRRQILENYVRKVRGDLRLAQELALVGKKPAGCTTLFGYKFIRAGEQKYELRAYCSPEGEINPPHKEVNLPLGITLQGVAGGNAFMFTVVHGSVVKEAGPPGNISITLEFLTGGVPNRVITVTPTGEIFD